MLSPIGQAVTFLPGYLLQNAPFGFNLRARLILKAESAMDPGVACWGILLRAVSGCCHNP